MLHSLREKECNNNNNSNNNNPNSFYLAPRLTVHSALQVDKIMQIKNPIL